MTRILLDPTPGLTPSEFPESARLTSLAGATVGLLDISKARGDVFLAALAEELTRRGATIRRYRKPTFAKIAPVDLRLEIAHQCDAVIEALAD